MAMKSVTITSEPRIIEYGLPKVYTRVHWEDLWVEDKTVVPLESVWCAAPAMPTASFRYRYGPVLNLALSKDWADYAKDTGLRRRFVKLEWPMTRKKDGTWHYRNWYGVIEIDEDQMGGVVYKKTKSGTTSTTTGVQTYSCYGLEKLLADWPIRLSTINDGGSEVEVERALTFNRLGRPNRSVERTAGPIDQTFMFEPDLSVARYWSTRDIVEYLLVWQTPWTAADERLVQFKLSGLALPDWDKPEVSQETQTCLSLLQQLITRRQMLGWRLKVEPAPEGSEASDTVLVDIFSLSEEEIELPITGTPKISASSRQKSLDCDRDAVAHLSIKRSSVGLYDQVRVRGARMRSVGSFAFGDGTLIAGWDATLQTPYDAGASTASDYSDLDDEEKRSRNAAARGAAQFEEVYAFFRIPQDWDKQVADGENGFTNPMFPDSELGNAPVYLGECFVEPTMPLIQGIDYSNDAIANGTPSAAEFTTATNLEEMPPLVIFARPDKAGKWIAGDKMGLAGLLTKGFGGEGNTRFSVSVQVPHESAGVVLRVNGDPQHAIAGTDFNPLDIDEDLGDVDWRNAIVTLSLPWDRYCEGVWPEELPADIDCPRILILEAGDRYKKNYVAPNTVLGVDEDGELVRSTGGWIPKEGEDDDQHKLQAIAKLAHAWYGADHSVLSFGTHRLLAPSDLDVGDLIRQIGLMGPENGGHLESVNTTITEIRLTWPESENSQAQPPHLEFVTDSGELDPMQANEDPRTPRRT